MKDSFTTALYLSDFIWFWPTFGLFHFGKFPSYKRVKWGRLPGSSHNETPAPRHWRSGKNHSNLVTRRGSPVDRTLFPLKLHQWVKFTLTRRITARTFWTNNAIFKSFRNYNFPKLWAMVYSMTVWFIFHCFGLMALWTQLRKRWTQGNPFFKASAHWANA